MTKQKQSFVLYHDFYEPIKSLSTTDKGILLVAIFEYQVNGNLIELPPVIRMCFEFLRQQFDRDKVKYETECKKRAENGRLGGAAKAAKQPLANVASASTTKQPLANVADNEYDNDTDKDIKKELRKKNQVPELSFVAEPYRPCFEKWLTYKREIGSPYKGQTSLKTCYNQLLKMADSNPATAAAIVDNSIGNRYQGLFAPKGGTVGKPVSKQMNTWDDNGYGKDIPL